MRLLLILALCACGDQEICFVPADAGAEDIDLDEECETYTVAYPSSSTNSPSAAGN